MKSGAKNTGVTVSLCRRATWKRIFTDRTIYYSEPRENTIYRKSRNE